MYHPPPPDPEHSQELSHSNSPIVPDPQDLQASNSEQEITDLLDVPVAKKKSKVPRDEEPPTTYSHWRPTGVKKQAHIDSKRNTPRTSNQPFRLPPSLVSAYPALEPVQQQLQQEHQQRLQQLQQLQQIQQMPGSYRNFGETGPANGKPADQRHYNMAMQAQASYDPRPSIFYPPPQQLQGTYRTFEAKAPKNNIGTDPMPEAVNYHLADKLQAVRDQFGARLSLSYAEQSDHPEYSKFLRQEQNRIHDGLSEPKSPPYKSPFIHTATREYACVNPPKPELPPYKSQFTLAPLMEGSFAMPEESDTLDSFDFDAFLKEEDEKRRLKEASIKDTDESFLD